MGLFDRKQSNSTEKKKRSGRGGERDKGKREEREESEDSEERIGRRKGDGNHRSEGSIVRRPSTGPRPRKPDRKPRPKPRTPTPPPPPAPPNPDPSPPPEPQQAPTQDPRYYSESNAATVVHASSYPSSSSQFDPSSSSVVTGAAQNHNAILIRVHGMPTTACLNMAKTESFVSKAFAKTLNRVSSKPSSNARTYIDSMGNAYNASHRITVDVNELRNQYLYIVDGDLFQNVILGTEIASRLRLIGPDSRSSRKDQDKNVFSQGSLPVRSATALPPRPYGISQPANTSASIASEGYPTGTQQIQPAVNSNPYSDSQSTYSSHMGSTSSSLYIQYSQLGTASSAMGNSSYYPPSTSTAIAPEEIYRPHNYYSLAPRDDTGVSDHFQQQGNEGETSRATPVTQQPCYDSSKPHLSPSTLTYHDASEMP